MSWMLREPSNCRAYLPSRLRIEMMWQQVYILVPILGVPNSNLSVFWHECGAQAVHQEPLARVFATRLPKTSTKNPRHHCSEVCFLDLLSWYPIRSHDSHVTWTYLPNVDGWWLMVSISIGRKYKSQRIFMGHGRLEAIKTFPHWKFSLICPWEKLYQRRSCADFVIFHIDMMFCVVRMWVQKTGA